MLSEMAANRSFLYGRSFCYRCRLYGRNVCAYSDSLFMSFIRGVNGWLLGLVLGVLLICAIACLQYVTAWMGKKVAQRD